MNKFFESYIDLTAVITTLIIALVFTIISFRKGAIWVLPAFFTLFAPAAIIVFMTAHLTENTYRAIEGLINGTFDYSFRFYSLILLGVLVSICGIRYLKTMSSYLAGNTSAKNVLLRMGLIVLITAPLIPITSISAVPSIAIAISLTALPFARRKSRTADLKFIYTME